MIGGRYGKKDHWDVLAEEMRGRIALLPNERVEEIFQELLAKKFGPSPHLFPLDGQDREPEEEIKIAIFEAFAVETDKRRKGRLPMHFEDPTCRKCPTSLCEPAIKPRGYCWGCAS